MSPPSLSVRRHQIVVHHLQMLVSKERKKHEGVHVVIFPSFTAGIAVRLPTTLLGAFSSFKPIPTIETARLGT